MRVFTQADATQYGDDIDDQLSFGYSSNSMDVTRASKGKWRKGVNPELDDDFPWMRVRRLPKKG